MSIFSKIKNRVKSTRLRTKIIAAGITATIAGSAAAVALMSGAAASPVSTPNCDNNSVIAGGASSVSALQHDYNDGATCVSGGKTYSSSASSTQNIYKWYGITSSDIASEAPYVVNGYVTKSGDVYASGVLVATNALTGGRLNAPGSTEHDVNGTIFFSRPPAATFLDDELSALVVVKNGIFQYATLVSCGNPIEATPKMPAYNISKQVRAGTSGNYSSNVTVQSGSEVEYQITINSTGQLPADNVIAHDTLPSGITYKSGTLQENGQAVSSAATSAFFGSGLNIPTIINGHSTVFNFEAVAGSASYGSDSCKAETMDNTGYITSVGLPNGQSTAGVTTTCAPPASLSCQSLTAIGGTADTLTGDQEYTFTATATEQNISSLSYTFNFGDNSANTVVNSTSTKVNTSHTYAPGMYKATVTVSGTDSTTGKSYTATCSYSICVKAPVSGTLVCDSLTDTPGQQDATTGDTPYTFTANGSVVGNAKITGYSLTPNAGVTAVPMTMNANAQSATASYTYAPGTYTAKVTVTGTDLVTGKTITAPTTATCEKTITVNVPAKPGYAILKQVSATKDGTYGSDVTVASGTTVYYQITVSNTGNTAVTNVTASDKLPTNITYTTGTLQENGQAVSAADATNFFGNGLVIPSIATGSKVTFTYSAVAGNTSTPTDPSCTQESLTNTGSIMATGMPNESSNANVGTTCTKVPGSLACVALSAIAGSIDSTTGNQNYTFSGSATAGNATITTYTFTITNTDTNAVVATVPVSTGATSVTTTTPQTLAPGNYSASLIVAGTDNYGNAVTTSATPACETSFTIGTPTVPPTTLPNTGAGDTIAIFFGAIVAGTVASRFFLTRRLSRR